MATTVFEKPMWYNVATQSEDGLMSSTDKTKLDGVATGATANTGTITGITMNGSSKGTSGVVDLGTVITSHQDISGKVTGPSSATANAVAIFDGTGGKTIKNSGYTIGKSVPSDAKFTDTNTHRPIQVNGSQILGDNTTALNLKAGTNVSLSNSSGTVTITATDTNTWRGIQNNLTSTSTTESLSAYQGKLLNDNKLKTTTGTVTVTADGNADSGVQIPAISGATSIVGLVPLGYAPNSTWDTLLIFKEPDASGRWIYFRTHGGTRQTYNIYYLAFYR